MTDNLLTSDQAAAYLYRSLSWLYKRVGDGEIRPIRYTPAGPMLFSVGELERWRAERIQQAEAAREAAPK